MASKHPSGGRREQAEPGRPDRQWSVRSGGPLMRVLLADDHQLLRQAIRRALEDAGMTVVAEAADGGEAVRLAGELRPDVVVMDVSMPVLDGIEATRRVHADWPELPIVILTMHGDEAL